MQLISLGKEVHCQLLTQSMDLASVSKKNTHFTLPRLVGGSPCGENSPSLCSLVFIDIVHGTKPKILGNRSVNPDKYRLGGWVNKKDGYGFWVLMLVDILPQVEAKVESHLSLPSEKSLSNFASLYSMIYDQPKIHCWWQFKSTFW